ncbi:MAG: hypothetical protein WD894_22275 [Pirellulales bacterium]
MSEVRLIVRDVRRSLCGNVHGSVADALVAALSAEPETIEELQAAVVRFERPLHGPCLAWFHRGEDDTPWDAGLVIIDLAARLVVCESSYSSPGPDGCLQYHDGTRATDKTLRYHLPKDWEFTRYADGWQCLAKERRRALAARPPIDTRAILYGRPLVEFVAAELWTALASVPSAVAGEASKETADAPSWDDAEPEGANADDQTRAAIREVHVRWLMTPRDDLNGRTPREMMHEKREFIAWDMQDRCEQWSQLDESPPPLDPQSHAYRFAGYGVHEMVVYYYLVRHLLWSCRDLCAEFRSTPKNEFAATGDFLTTAVPQLEHLRDQWLDAPSREYHGRTPRSIIDRERRRMPEAMSRSEIMIDDDCPLCAMAADMPGPTFWHLDGCNMDPDFAFSIFERTREEWEEKEREYQEFNRKYNERQAERERLGVEYPGKGYSDPDYVWQRSFVAPESEETSLVMRLFSIGFNLSELICDLKEPPAEELKLPTDQRDLIDGLSRDFGNLRDVVQSPDASLGAALIEPVLDRFCETLAAVTDARNDLEPKCTDLQQQLRRFLHPPSETDDSASFEGDDDLPF